MSGIDDKKSAKLAVHVFTNKKRYIIINEVVNQRRFLISLRYSMAKLLDFPVGIPPLYLGGKFRMIFYSDKNPHDLDLDILKYIVQVKRPDEVRWKYKLDLEGMSKDIAFKHLFPKNFHALRKSTDIIRFFINIENERFLYEFSLLPNSVTIDKSFVPEMFLKELGYDGKPVWESWVFSKLVYKKPHNIYDAFIIYAYKKYTLLRFGLPSGKPEMDAIRKAGKKAFNEKMSEKIPSMSPAEKESQEEKFITNEIYEAGKKVFNDKVSEVIPSMLEPEKAVQEKYFIQVNKRKPEPEPEPGELEKNWHSARSVFAEEVLEYVPEGTSKYVPKDLDVFERQLRSGTNHFRYETIQDLNYIKIYEPKDLENIKTYMEKVEQYNKPDYLDFCDSHLDANCLDKAKFLYSQRLNRLVNFSESQRGIIDGLYDMLPPDSIDQPMVNKDGKSFTLAETETVADKNIPQIIDALVDEFQLQLAPLDLAEEKVADFQKLISEYFRLNHKDEKGTLNLSRYLTEKLAYELFKLSGLEGIEDRNLMDMIYEMIRRTIVEFNIGVRYEN
jgi:hypothetical protein